jgi:hypothetical protein
MIIRTQMYKMGPTCKTKYHLQTPPSTLCRNTMSLPPQDTKSVDDIQLLETAKGQALTSEHSDLVSNYDQLSKYHALRKFWRLFLVGMLVASAGL